MKIIEQLWDDIKRGENIDLYITVVAAFGLAILNLFGMAPQQLISTITMTILGLLAVTNLGNRHHIQEQLRKFTSQFPHLLKDRSELPSFQVRGQYASEIFIVGVSATTAVTPHLDFFERKMKDGCKLRFLLLDPNSQACQVFSQMSKVPNVKTDIDQTLRLLELLKKMERTCKGVCEVKLSSVFLPFGLAAFDPDKDTGLMNVEMYAYRRTIGERPHLILDRTNDRKWFEYYQGQYEQLWEDSTTWKPKLVD